MKYASAEKYKDTTAPVDLIPYVINSVEKINIDNFERATKDQVDNIMLCDTINEKLNKIISRDILYSVIFLCSIEEVILNTIYISEVITTNHLENICDLMQDIGELYLKISTHNLFMYKEYQKYVLKTENDKNKEARRKGGQKQSANYREPKQFVEQAFKSQKWEGMKKIEIAKKIFTQMDEKLKHKINAQDPIKTILSWLRKFAQKKSCTQGSDVIISSSYD